MAAFLKDLQAGVNNLWNQIVAPPICDLVLWNDTPVDLSLPVGRSYSEIRQGEVLILSEVFFTLKSLKSGQSGKIRFQPAATMLPTYHAAVEIEAPNDGFPPDRLFIGASTQMPGCVVADWNVPGGLSRFLELLPIDPVPRLVLGEGYLSELSIDNKLGGWKLVVRSRTATLNTRLINAPIVQGDFRLSLEFVNYTETGLSLPPNYAHMQCGCVEKDLAYIGPNQKGCVEFGGSPEFAGRIFVQVAPLEILVVACKGTSGDVRLSLQFHDVNAHVGLSVLPSESVHLDRFCGGQHDETILGRHCEALITNAKMGDNASVTIAIYSRESNEL
eukprot:GEMP01029524.1.p1 GENE.GEMP01029524.1~~GEMP01029524.1.p1  ORF type:complete len:331 (+),score=41.71 GEMP01029524.1:113-1105(+)